MLFEYALTGWSDLAYRRLTADVTRRLWGDAETYLAACSPPRIAGMLMRAGRYGERRWHDPPNVDEFLDAAPGLDAAAFARIRATVAEDTAAGRRDASRARRMAPAEFSALDRRVRDVLRPRSEEFRAKPGGLRAAIGTTEVAAQAVWKRGSLTAEQFESFVGPFRAEGVDLPTHV